MPPKYIEFSVVIGLSVWSGPSGIFENLRDYFGMDSDSVRVWAPLEEQPTKLEDFITFHEELSVLSILVGCGSSVSHLIALVFFLS